MFFDTYSDYIFFGVIILAAGIVLAGIGDAIYDAVNPVSGIISAKQIISAHRETYYNVVLKMPMTRVVPDRFQVYVIGQRKNGSHYEGWISVEDGVFAGIKKGDPWPQPRTTQPRTNATHKKG